MSALAPTAAAERVTSPLEVIAERLEENGITEPDPVKMLLLGYCVGRDAANLLADRRRLDFVVDAIFGPPA